VTTYDLFFKLADTLGLTRGRLHPPIFLRGGVVPASCRERGGRTTELYELTLRRDAGPPECWWHHNDDDDDE
jgi:hypothetical protein